MRVTNSMLVSNFMNNLNVNTNKISNLQYQLATGKKNSHISDDPISLVYSQQARLKLARLEDYRANVKAANNYLTTAEAGAMEISDIFASVYERCMDAATDVKNDKDLTNIAKYIGQMRDQLLTALNTAFGDKYVFAGYNTTGYTDPATGEKKLPFEAKDVIMGQDADGNDIIEKRLFYNGHDLHESSNYTDPGPPVVPGILDELREELLSFEVALGVDMPVTVNGLDLFFYDPSSTSVPRANLYTLLDDFYNLLMSAQEMKADNDPEDLSTYDNDITAEDIQAFLTPLQKAQNHMLAHVADLGGRVNRLEILEDRYAADEINYTQMLSDAEDIDYAEAMMNYMMAYSVYQASLQAGAMIIQPTLMDYLR